MSEPTLTLQEAATLLDPPMTILQLSALVVIASIQKQRIRRTGRKGWPAIEFSASDLMRAHAAEARRTTKQFTDTDWMASALLGRRLVTVDAETGAVWRPDGTRAERLRKSHYGMIPVGRTAIPAHRLVWIAIEGEIPAGLQINHINKLRWDNRRANLELVTLANNMRHRWDDPSYLSYGEAVQRLAELTPAERCAQPNSAMVPANRIRRRRGTELAH